MFRRRDLAQISAVLAVQRARRLAAEVDVERALTNERAARDASDAARESCDAAHEQWAKYVNRGGFSPEYSRALSARLIHREGEARDAAAQADRKRDERVSKQEGWKERQAEVRQTERTARRIKRRVERYGDERRLAEANDRTTYTWWQQ
jgi:hypothetical protein